ncbi:MAG: arginine--tRNA ligase [Candidatus Omnitrophica bacterium]|nr:arginine--tRNA ligase [Candidatus Omnitrophota bacterium]
MKDTIQEDIIKLITGALADLGIDNVLPEQVRLDIPEDLRFGDFSTNIALRLSRELKTPADKLASEILSNLNLKLDKMPLAELIREIKVAGKGFINFYLSDQYLYQKLNDIVAKGIASLRLNLGMDRQVLIEFVSANPTGSLSVAHARQAAVGDALCSILKFLHFKVTKEYYLNDEGNQIAILGNSVNLRIKELSGERIEFPENYYQGGYIYDIAKEAKQRGLQEKDLSDFSSQYILDIIKKELDDFGVKFDSWYSQKELNKSGKIEEALNALKKKGLSYDQEGALWFKSTLFGDDKDRVLIKSDGSYTYLSPDIAYHDDKYKRGFDWLINLWGPDHHGYINRLKASVEAFGRDPNSLSVLIVQLATIFRDGKPVQMSTRRAEYITLREVLEEVGKDASRFFFLSRRISSHLDFDLNVAKKQNAENPVFYIQYAYARINSILKNSPIRLGGKVELSLLKEEEERALIKKLLQFPYMLTICLNTQDPYMLTVYLQGLAEAFHKFYDLHRVLTEEENLTKARLYLIEAVRIVIGAALDLLGISCPKEM